MGLRISKNIPFHWQREHTWGFLKYARQFSPILISTEVDLSKIQKLFKSCQNNICKVGYTSMVVKSAADSINQSGIGNLSIRQYPTKRIITFKSLSAKVTVEREVDGIPVVFPGLIENVDQLTVLEIEQILRYYSETPIGEIPLFKKILRMDRYPAFIRNIWIKTTALRTEGLHKLLGSFTVTSLGKYGIDVFFPLIASTITLGVGAVKDRPVVKTGKIVIHPVITLNLIFDHRVVDGANAARLLEMIRKRLETGDYLNNKG